MGNKISRCLWLVLLAMGLFAISTGRAYGVMSYDKYLEYQEEEVWRQYLETLSEQEKLNKMDEGLQRYLKAHPGASVGELDAELRRLGERYGWLPPLTSPPNPPSENEITGLGYRPAPAPEQHLGVASIDPTLEQGTEFGKLLRAGSGNISENRFQHTERLDAARDTRSTFSIEGRPESRERLSDHKVSVAPQDVNGAQKIK